MSTLTGPQIRSARAALGITVAELSKLSDVSARTIARIEAVDGVSSSTSANLNAIRSALENAGIEFIQTHDGGRGVLFRPPR
ncbi:helix-turn-helix domain-containing protein [Roseovarius sp. S4756]|uniref:helix-turn-helix domain-containing protein n=1 Tax=Roseovarius maritimus TaxID=3342637 RepID=UPI003727EE95